MRLTEEELHALAEADFANATDEQKKEYLLDTEKEIEILRNTAHEVYHYMVTELEDDGTYNYDLFKRHYRLSCLAEEDEKIIEDFQNGNPDVIDFYYWLHRNENTTIDIVSKERVSQSPLEQPTVNYDNDNDFPF